MWIFLFFSAIIILFLASGRLLDWEAQRAAYQVYLHDADGVINKAQSVVIENGHENALLLIHGHLSSPQIFHRLVNDIKASLPADIYVPLLPFHGRDLKTASKMNNAVIFDFLQTQILQLSTRYKRVTVVGLSYGGCQVLALATKTTLPDNVYIILQSPAIFIGTNKLSWICLVRLYMVWRNYCNYPALGAKFPCIDSVEKCGTQEAAENISLQYFVISALLELYKCDKQNREALAKLTRPHTVLMATNDFWVEYKRIKQACTSNVNYCVFYSFTTGNHLLHLSEHRKEIQNIIIETFSAWNKGGIPMRKEEQV